MKKRTLFRACMFTAAICFLLCSCASAPSERARLSYEEEGMRLIGRMDQLAESQEYIASFGIEEISSLAAEIGNGDYTAPEAIYQAVFSKPLYTTVSSGEFKSIPAETGNCIDEKLLAGIPTKINQRTSVSMVSASGILYSAEAFEPKENKGTVLLLYEFEGPYWAAVTYYPQTNGLILASSYFISDDLFKAYMDGFQHSSSSASIEVFLKQVLETEEITVTEVPIP